MTSVMVTMSHQSVNQSINHSAFIAALLHCASLMLHVQSCLCEHYCATQLRCRQFMNAVAIYSQ